jgi:erythrocyte membrane protein band 4.1
MTTESGSDSESKPDQEAEPQEAAGPQGHEAEHPGPAEPPAESGEEPALEQFAGAAAHSTPVHREVSGAGPQLGGKAITHRLPSLPGSALSPLLALGQL